MDFGLRGLGFRDREKGFRENGKETADMGFVDLGVEGFYLGLCSASRFGKCCGGIPIYNQGHQLALCQTRSCSDCRDSSSFLAR